MPAFSKNPTKSHILLILGVSLLSSRQVYAQAPSLALASGSTAKGGSIPLNLSFSAASQSTAGLQWTLTYPTAGVTSLTAATGTARTAAGKNLSCNRGVGTLICLATGANATAIGSGVVAVVTATLSASSNATLDSLSMSNVFGTLAMERMLILLGRAGQSASQPRPPSQDFSVRQLR